MNWVRPTHRWILDPVCWIIKDMVEDMLNGLIKAPPERIAFWIRVLIMLSPRDNEEIVINCSKLK